MDEKKIVVIPTYNESENIKSLLEEIFATIPTINVLVVDDSSPDGTGRIVKEIMDKDKRVFLLERPAKLGIGSAYVKGFLWALEKEYELIFQMDSDFSHQPKYLLDMLNTIRDSDFVIGSRYIPRGGTENWSLMRKFLSKGGNFYARMILGLPISDLTSGFKCFRKEVLQSIDLENIKSEGYSFQIEMTYRAVSKGFRAKEIPIIFVDRTKGVSKLSQKILFEAFFMPWRLRFGK